MGGGIGGKKLKIIVVAASRKERGSIMARE